jgi:hypothetical protein
MENVLTGLARYCLPSTLMVGKDFWGTCHNLRDVFSHLSKAGLKLKPNKCSRRLSSWALLSQLMKLQRIQKKVFCGQLTDQKALRTFHFTTVDSYSVTRLSHSQFTLWQRKINLSAQQRCVRKPTENHIDSGTCPHISSLRPWLAAQDKCLQMGTWRPNDKTIGAFGQ